MFKDSLSGFRAASMPSAVLALCCAAAMGQQARQYTNEDYAGAERFMSYNVNPLASKGVVNARWLDDGRFWYRDADATGVSFVLVDPARATRSPAFDQVKLAAALKEASSGAIKDDARHLPVTELSLSDQDHVLTLTVSGSVYRCKLGAEAASCKRLLGAGGPAQGPDHADKQPPLTLSPNKKLGAFIRDWNLWVRDLATGAETQLTTDGEKDFGYATDNAGWQHATGPSCFGRRIRRKSPRSSRTSASRAKCTWCR